MKVLVDLAMISAEGQGDLEVQKVSCLHAAATGYAPLIYDLKPDMSFSEFLPLCQAVWRALDVDKKLPQKFVSLHNYFVFSGILIYQYTFFNVFKKPVNYLLTSVTCTYS